MDFASNHSLLDALNMLLNKYRDFHICTSENPGSRVPIEMPPWKGRSAKSNPLVDRNKPIYHPDATPCTPEDSISSASHPLAEFSSFDSFFTS